MLAEKHQDAFRTIGEVSIDVGVATHVLRFWETQFSQIKPQKRRGRRYYRQEDIATIKVIKGLLYEQGYTIKGVCKFLKGKNKLAAVEREPVETGQQQTVDHIINTAPKQLNTLAIAQLQQVHVGLCTLRAKMLNISS